MLVTDGNMGLWSALKSLFRKKQQNCRILVVGLDNSGKTTILNKIKPAKAALLEVVPTVGFNLEEFAKNNLQFTCYDMSGHSKYRELWTRFYAEAQAIIFVLDATDRLRLNVAKAELDEILNHPDIRSRPIPILIFANKMDLPNAITPVECTEELRLHEITSRPWTIIPSVAINGDGLEEGVSWLTAKFVV